MGPTVVAGYVYEMLILNHNSLIEKLSLFRVMSVKVGMLRCI